jgi:hypothetical protein
VRGNGRIARIPKGCNSKSSGRYRITDLAVHSSKDYVFNDR